MESPSSVDGSNIRIFHHIFSQELWGLEDWNLVHTWAVGRCIIYTGVQLLLLISPFISSFFFLSNFQHWNFLSHFSQELWGLEDWKLVHTWTVGRCIMYTGIRLLLHIHPFISSFFFLSNFQHWNFSSHFSRDLWGLEDWKLVHTWTVGRCIVYTRIRLLLLIHPFISSFFFRFQFSTLKFFITLFSGTMRPRRLKLGTHIDSWQMYLVYWNQAATAIHPLISSFFFLSNFQTLKFFITLFLGTVRPRRLKLGTHVDSGQMYRVYWNQATAAYLSLYFFIFLSLQLSNIKNFRHIFLRNCEV